MTIEDFKLYSNPNAAAEQAAVAKAKRAKERFAVVGNGTVIDIETGLMWAAEDSYKNGKEYGLDWHEAKAYCESYRGAKYSDWRMPSLAELKGLYAAFVEMSVEELEEEYWSKEEEGNKIKDENGNIYWDAYGPEIDVSEGGENAGGARSAPVWIYAAAWSYEQTSSSSHAANVKFDDGLVYWYDLSYRGSYSGALPVRVCK